MNFSFTECALYAFHHIAAKAKKTVGSVCGLDVMSKEEFTGQPKDMHLFAPNVAQVRLRAVTGRRRLCS